MDKNLKVDVYHAGKGMRTAITSHATAEDVSFTIVMGGTEQTVKRDIILDQQFDGSWGFNVYARGNDTGGGILLDDDEYVYLMSMIVELLLDPDKFGDRRLKIMPPETGKDAA